MTLATPPQPFARRRALVGGTLLVLVLAGRASPSLRAAEKPILPVKLGAEQRLEYEPGPRGDRVVDFSSAGYGGGGIAIPLAPVRMVVAPEPGHDTERIQAALDLVARLPGDAGGLRGAVLLLPGEFRVNAPLRLAASGVVLRGSGEDPTGTVLVAERPSRRTLILVGGRGERQNGPARPVTDAYVPVGATRLTVNQVSGLAAGSRIAVQRPATAEWIAALGMDAFSGWRPEHRVSWGAGSRDLLWERRIIAIDGNTLTLDAPLTTALDVRFGGGTVAPTAFPGRIARVGVENLRCVSEFDPSHPQDEEHAWVGVALDAVEDAWVRRVTCAHFVGSAVDVQADARAVTVEDCTALDPVSELAAWRRRSFVIAGQQVLVQRCRSEHGLHDFTTGFTAAGPNVFLQCTARTAGDWSGPQESWASGVLYDNVIIRGNALRFLNRGANGQGAGWTTANSVLWNCESTELQVQSPPDAPNQALGCKGLIVDDSLRYDPRIMPYRDFVRGAATTPASLYRQQLAERLGRGAGAGIVPATIDVSPGDVRRLTDADLPPAAPAPAVHPLRIENGEFVIDGQPAWTAQTNWSFFQGQMPRPLARSSGAALTRFAPGETGTGQTDDLELVVEHLPPGTAFTQYYGLWYDRRRINHNFYGAPELPASDVSAPFMESPWARSGEGTDWDGMSKYDLTKFNPWYFERIKTFADLCDTHGRVLYYNFYLQHPVQETRAHYVDFPWRPVNCLQTTDLPDENPAGSTFYDIGHPVRRDLHRRYLRHCLDVLKDDHNVVFGIDREYSGPLRFVQFWLDTIAEWSRENSRAVTVALEVPKAEMDALLEDPVRRPLIAAVGFHHWQYRADGSLFAIAGGLNLAPREQLQAADKLPHPAPGGPIQRYRAQREYRDAYPGLVLLNQQDEFPELSAAVAAALPEAARATLRPLAGPGPADSWVEARPGKSYLAYLLGDSLPAIDLPAPDPAAFQSQWITPHAAPISAPVAPRAGATRLTLQRPAGLPPGPCAVWITRTP